MSDGQIHSDVFVAGLGPAGACAAAEAAKAGWSVIAVDRKSQAGVPVQCAELVPGPIGMEVCDVSVAHEQIIRSMVTFVEDATPETVENFPGHMINRRAFDRHLCMLAEEEGAQTVFGTTVRSISTGWCSPVVGRIMHCTKNNNWGGRSQILRRTSYRTNEPGSRRNPANDGLIE